MLSIGQLGYPVPMPKLPHLIFSYLIALTSLCTTPLVFASSPPDVGEPKPSSDQPTQLVSADCETVLDPVALELPTDWTSLNIETVLGVIASEFEKLEANLERVVSSTEHPTFQNTIAPFLVDDHPGYLPASQFLLLARVFGEERYPARDPRLSEMIETFKLAVIKNETLVARVRKVYDMRGRLSFEDRIATEKFYQSFQEAGADLNPKDRVQLRDLNLQLNNLYQDYVKIQLKAESELSLHVEKLSDVKGMSETQIVMMKEEAAKRGITGFVLQLSNSTLVDAMLRADNEFTRQKAYDVLHRVFERGAYDLTAIVHKIMKVRSQIKNIQRAESFATLEMRWNSEKDPSYVIESLESFLGTSRPQLITKWLEIKSWGATQFPGLDLEKPWNIPYVRGRYSAHFFGDDDEATRAYFPLSHVLPTALSHFEKLFDVHFDEVTGDYSSWHHDVRIFRVRHRDNTVLGHLYWDPYERENKASGAGAMAIRSQGLHTVQRADQTLQAVRLPSIVGMVTNFRPAVGGQTEPLLTFRDVETLFHELGHVMHSLMSQVKWTSIAGTSVPRDTVEYPSSLMELWLQDPQFLQSISRHVKTGEPIDKNRAEKWLEYRKFARERMSYSLALSALADQWIHHKMQSDWSKDKLHEAELEVLKRHALFRNHDLELVSPPLAHLFGGGYEAQYYSYLWGENLALQFWERIQASGDLYDPELLSELREQLSNRGAPFYK